jgi:hypothetical protein
MKKTYTALAVFVLCLSGCASIFKGSTQAVTFRSEPESAALSITNRAGEAIHVGTTPATITLKRGAGYFQSEIYKVVMKKEGFADKELTITSTVSGWYIGNLLFGGLLGLLIVDPATGGMYVFPDSVTGTLESPTEKSASAQRSLTIVNADTVSPEDMKKARPFTPGNRP